MSSASVTPSSVPLRAAVAALPAYVPGARPGPGERLWKLSSNENPFPPLPSVLAAAADAASSMNRYPDMYATPVVTRVAELLAVDAAQVVVGNGSVAVLAHLLSAVVEPDDEVIYAWRSFEAYPIAVAVSGGRSVHVPLLPDGRHDLAAMTQAARSPRARVVLVCTPNNPTGPVITGAEMESFIESIPDDVMVVIDEAYLEFVASGSGAADDAAPGETLDALDLLRRFDNVVLLRTLSKAYGLAGMRVGYCVAHPALAAGVRAVSTPFGVTVAAQAAAVAALEPEALAVMRERVAALVAERTRVLAGLRAQGWDVPDSHANFVWLPLGARTAELAAAARAAGILTRPFKGEGLRVSIGEPEANSAFLELAATWRTP